MDGTQVDLVKEGVATSDMIQGFAVPDMDALNLSSIDPSKLVDSDKIAQQGGSRGSSATVGIAMLAPNGLGMGPLPTPQSGGQPAQLAYELFNVDPQQSGSFILYDATTGATILDTSNP